MCSFLGLKISPQKHSWFGSHVFLSSQKIKIKVKSSPKGLTRIGPAPWFLSHPASLGFLRRLLQVKLHPRWPALRWNFGRKIRRTTRKNWLLLLGIGWFFEKWKTPSIFWQTMERKQRSSLVDAVKPITCGLNATYEARHQETLPSLDTMANKKNCSVNVSALLATDSSTQLSVQFWPCQTC